MDIRWFAITGPGGPGEPHALYVARYEAARIVERLNGTWFAMLRYPGQEAVNRPCTSYDAGRAGIEAWARRHYDALEATAERRGLEWLARQTWRGTAATEAQERLSGMR